MPRKIRVLVGKPGLDGHDRGAKVVAAALRDAGMEVIYTGLHQTAEQIVEAALQEDVDVVALSILSGAHMTLFPEVHKLMRARRLTDRLLTGGGIIPPEDMDTLATMGVGRLFGPGSSTQDIVAYIRAWFATQHGADALTPLPPPREPQSFVPAGSPPAATSRAPDAHHRRGAARTGAKAKTGSRRKGAKPSRSVGGKSARSKTSARSDARRQPSRKTARPATRTARRAKKKSARGR